MKVRKKWLMAILGVAVVVAPMVDPTAGRIVAAVVDALLAGSGPVVEPLALSR